MQVPDNVRWLLAVAGVVLLAAAVLGGGLQLKELTIPRIGRGQRLLAAVMGLIFGLCAGI